VWEYQSSKSGSYIINGYSSGNCTAARASSIGLTSQAGVWRIYSFEWNANEMKWWYRDDADPATQVRGLQTKSISGCSSFTKNLFYLINIAVGGTLGYPVNCSFPQTMELDYLRTYKLSTDPQVSIRDLPESAGLSAIQGSGLTFLSGQSKMQFVNPTASQTRIAVTDLSGRLISVLFDGTLSKGSHSFAWDRKHNGSGVFMATIKSGSKTAYCKIACY
jgi:hypothetical protein